MKVLVCHPGLQHAHQMAAALHESGQLMCLITGVPLFNAELINPAIASASTGRRRLSLLHRLMGICGQTCRTTVLDASVRRHWPIFPVLRKLSARLLPRSWARAADYALCAWFDWITARYVRLLRPDAVICYENAALRTFQAARQIGVRCILDAAAVHPDFSHRVLSGTPAQDRLSVRLRKQREMDLADAILTCSDFAAQTYVQAGVPAQRVHPVLLGCSLPAPVPQDQSAYPLYDRVDPSLGRQVDPGGLRFVFVGNASYVKGIDWLLSVFETLAQQRHPARLTVIGTFTDPVLQRRSQSLPNVRCTGYLTGQSLLRELSSSDCLVLPSRLDSFGLVVVEALACGVPVLVSTHVGAKAVVEHHPGCGWVFSPGETELLSAIMQLVSQPERIVQAREHTRAAAQAFSWQAYRQRARRMVGDILETPSSPATGLRILHVIPSVAACHGGPTHALARMLDALERMSIRCDVATTDDDGPNRRLSIQDCQQRSVLPSGRCHFFAKVTEFYKIAPALAVWLLRHVRDYDVVHIHALFSFSSVAAGLIARWRGVPYVVRPLGTLSHYGVRQRRPLLKRLSMALLEGPVLQRADAVHFTAAAEQQEAGAWGLKLRSHIIPLAVVSQWESAEVAKVSRNNLPNDAQNDAAHVEPGYVLYLSRIDPKKNLESLLQAFARLQQTDPGLRLVIAGDGDVQYVASLRQMALQLGIAPRIEWVGFVSGVKKMQLLAHARIFVLPSFSENFGIAAAEALAAGCPCLLTHGVAIAGDVAQAGAGLAVHPDAISLSQGLAQMLASADCLHQMSLRAASLAQTAYSVAGMGRALCHLYTRLKEHNGLEADNARGFDLQ